MLCTLTQKNCGGTIRKERNESNMSIEYKDYRCSNCKKLLFRGWLSEAEVEIKCKSCHECTVISESKFNEMLCGVVPCPHRIAIEKKSH